MDAPGQDSLPREIWQLIASYVDPPSATALSTTCHALRIPAETHLWRSLSIKPSDLILAGNVDEPDHQSDSAHHPRSFPTSNIVRKMCSMLLSEGRRASLVKSLELPLRTTVPSELAILFRLVARSLVYLRITMPIGFDPDVYHPSCIPLVDVIRTLPTLHNLRNITLTVHESPGSVIDGLLSAAPGLEELTVFNRSAEAEKVGPKPSHLPKVLRAFRVDKPATVTEAVGKIIQSSANISAVELIDETFGWRPKRDDCILVALASRHRLSDLEITCYALRRFAEMDVGPALRHLSVLWDHVSLEAPAAIATLIPPFQSLETYHLCSSFFASVAFRNHYPSRPPHVQALGMLANLTPRHLSETPNLHTICCPLYVGFQPRASIGKMDFPSHKDHTFQGVLIYSYFDTMGTELIHLRHHISTSHALCRGSRCLICPVGWQDRAWWGDKEIPLSVLRAAYAAAGCEITEMQPARGQVLDKQAWKVIESWQKNEEIEY